MFIVSMLAGLFFVGAPISLIVGEDVGVWIGLVAGFALYLYCGTGSV